MAKTTYTPAQAAAIKRHQRKLSRVSLWMTPEEKQCVEEAAERAGMSLNAFFRSAAAEKIERDQLDTDS